MTLVGVGVSNVFKLKTVVDCATVKWNRHCQFLLDHNYRCILGYVRYPFLQLQLNYDPVSPSLTDIAVATYHTKRNIDDVDDASLEGAGRLLLMMP